MTAITLRAVMNTSAVIQALGNLPREMAFTNARALTRTAQDCQKAIRREMQTKFDRPTPYALNSTRIRSATTSRLMAEVYLKDEATKADSAATFLAPQIEGSAATPLGFVNRPGVGGGSRAKKKFERALEAKGILPDRYYAVPGRAAELDAYGNMKRTQIVQMLAALDAFGEQGYKANMGSAGRGKLRRGTKKRMGRQYFAVTQSGKPLAPGVWTSVRTGFGWSRPEAVVVFVKKPFYKPRIAWDSVLTATALREGPINLELSLEQTVRRLAQSSSTRVAA